MLKKCVAAILLLLVIGTSAIASHEGLTDEEYETFYAVSQRLCADMEAPLLDLLAAMSQEHGMSAEALYEFVQRAVLEDGNHVWVPAKGGKKYHAKEECSQMIEPRPATKEMAYGLGLTPCKRCDPGA